MREYTDPVVLTTGVDEGWADRETDPTEIDWERRRKRAKIPFEVVDGRPVNPREKTRIQRGRNKLGRWGENLTAHALVWARDEHMDRWVLLTRRSLLHDWGLPGGFPVNEGESAVEATIREFGKISESRDRRNSPHLTWRETKPRYESTARASDEAWLVTTMCVAHLGRFKRREFPSGGVRRTWVRANGYQELRRWLRTINGTKRLSANHAAMLADWFGGA